jgi:hypothetical protein
LWLSFGAFIGILLKVWLDCGSECLSRSLQQVDDGAILRLEAAAFGFSHALVRNFERGEVGEGFAGPLQALLQVGAERGEHCGVVLLRPDDGDRVGNQVRPLALGTARAPCRDEGESFALREAMAVNRRQDRFLSAIAQSAQRVGQSRADGSLVHLPLDCRTEPRGQGQPTCDPRFAPAEQMRDAGQAQAILLDQ